MKSIEVQLNEALATIESQKNDITKLKEALNKQQVATASVERAGKLAESKLPEPCVIRINEAFKSSTDNAGLKEAINVEAEYVKSLQGAARKHNGTADNGGQNMTEAEQAEVKKEEFKERQFKAYRATGMNEAEASAASGFKPRK